MQLIIIIFIVFFSCNEQVQKHANWVKKAYHVDTIMRPEMVMADLDISRIYADTVYELWINTETGSSPYHYLDKNKKELPENIMVMPDAKKGLK